METIQSIEKAKESSSEFILQAMGTAVCKHLLDDSLTILWANQAFYQFIGYDEKEFSYKFSCLAKYGEYKMFNMKTLIQHFQTAYKQGKTSTEYILPMPINHNKIQWVKMSATFFTSDDEYPIVYILYNDINDIITEKEKLYYKEKESMEILEWMLSEYAGNVYISDMDTYELLYLNKHSCDTLGESNEGVLGKKCYEVIQGRTSPCPFCTNPQLVKNETYEWEFYNHKLKRTFMIKNRALDWKGHNARLELSYDMYSAEYKLAKKDQEREAILKTIPAGMVRIDARDNRTVLWYNDIFLNMIAYSTEQFKKELHGSCTYMHPDDFKRACILAANMHETGDNIVFEARAYTRTKEERIWTVTLCYVSGDDSWDGIPSFYSIGLDITDERKKLENLKHIAEKDALTNIYNRLETEKQIMEYLVENTGEKGALFMIDTDDFKQINDNNGHLIGDMVLAEMAAGMKKIMRDSDVVGRIGGDEFTIFMKDVKSREDVDKKAEELLYMFQELFNSEKSPVKVTCSIGISMYPKDGCTFKDMYAKADRALYEAKSQGKNKYVIYDSEILKGLSNNYSANRTIIESEKRYAESSDNLTRYVFRTMFETKDFDKAINSILDIVGKQYDVSRAYVFENSDDGQYSSNTYEWCNKGVTSEIVKLQNCDMKALGNYEKLFGEDSIFYCRDIQTLKTEQKAVFSEQGIHSTLQCAIWDDKKFKGFVGFDECTGQRLWTKEEVSTLSLISQILSIFLNRKEAKSVSKKRQQYLTVLNGLKECICVIEENSNLLLFKNTKFINDYPEFEIGEEWHDDLSLFHKEPIAWNDKSAYLCVKYEPFS